MFENNKRDENIMCIFFSLYFQSSVILQIIHVFLDSLFSLTHFSKFLSSCQVLSLHFLLIPYFFLKNYNALSSGIPFVFCFSILYDFHLFQPLPKKALKL